MILGIPDVVETCREFEGALSYVWGNSPLHKSQWEILILDFTIPGSLGSGV